MLSEAFSSRKNISGDELTSEGSTTSLGTTNTDDELSSRSSDNILFPRSLKKEPRSDSDLSSAWKSNLNGSESGRKQAKLDISRTANGGTEVLEIMSEAPNDAGTSGATGKRKSMTELESMEAPSPDLVKKKVMSPRRASEGNLIVPKKQQGISDSSVARESKDHSAESTGTSSTEHTSITGRRQRRKSAERARRTSDGNLPRVRSPDPSTPSDKVPPPQDRVRSVVTNIISRDSNRPSSAVTSAAASKRKPPRPVPVARPISAQPSQALRRMAEQKRQEEGKEREEEKEREREKMEREREKIEGVRKQTSQPDGDTECPTEDKRRGDMVDDSEEGRLEDATGEREEMSLKEVMDPANGTPKHKKSLPVRNSSVCDCAECYHKV